MYKKILVPLDGSHRSIAAAEHAVEIALKMGAKLTLFHVVPNISPYVSNYSNNVDKALETITQEFETLGENLLQEAEKKIYG